jgi:xanthine dehydrogenase iron-sulfur cluster and FAD-binding subunit A
MNVLLYEQNDNNKYKIDFEKLFIPYSKKKIQANNMSSSIIVPVQKQETKTYNKKEE